MRPYDLHFFPHPPLYTLAFLLLLALAVVFLRYYLIGHAYEKLGLSRRAAIAILFAALLGSGINIPVVQLPAERVVEPRIIQFFGMQYVIPSVVERQSTVIAVNVGGAVIPVLLVMYLVAKFGISRRGLLALAVVTLVTHVLAHPFPASASRLPATPPVAGDGGGERMLLDTRAALGRRSSPGTLCAEGGTVGENRRCALPHREQLCS